MKTVTFKYKMLQVKKLARQLKNWIDLEKNFLKLLKNLDFHLINKKFLNKNPLKKNEWKIW